MEFTAQAIADLLNGKVEGNPEVKVSNVSKIEEGVPGTLTFLANPKYEPYIYQTKASIVIVNNDFAPTNEVEATLIRVENAYQSIAVLLEFYNKSKTGKSGVDALAFVHETAQVSEGAYIAPFVYVGENAKVGANVKLHPHVHIGANTTVGDGTELFTGVKIYHDCVIGKDCIVHAGAVIGGDGFGFAPQAATNFKKVPQIGNVVLEDLVEIGANTTIDRATLGSTIIRRGVKLDNLIQVAHNVEIGENTVIAAQTGISGSTKIGKDCMIAGQVGIVGHITIEDGVKIGAQSGISGNTKQGAILLGTPAVNIMDARKTIAVSKRLPQLDRKLDQLEREIEALKKQLNSSSTT